MEYKVQSTEYSVVELGMKPLDCSPYEVIKVPSTLEVAQDDEKGKGKVDEKFPLAPLRRE